MNGDALLVAGIIAGLLIIAAVAWYYYAAPHPSQPSVGVSESEINSIGSGYGEMNMPSTLGNESNLPNPDAISVDENDVDMNLPSSI